MKNQKGITMIALILIVVVVVILGIIFIVKMSQPQDGIGSIREEQEKLNRAIKEKEKADEQYQKAINNLTKQQTITSTAKNYQQIYNEYSQRLINAGPTSSINEMAEICNDGIMKMAQYMYSAHGTDGQYSTYQSWVDKLYNVYISNCR